MAHHNHIKQHHHIIPFLNIMVDWCLGMAWSCTPVELIGLWSVWLFYTVFFIVTITHYIMQDYNGTIQLSTSRHNDTINDDLGILCMLMLFFFGLVIGCLIWVTAGIHWIQLAQIWEIQLIGSLILLICAFLFVKVHTDMGKNWSPIPGQKTNHELVTHGTFRWARHPMYAVFLWAAIASFLATFNWVISWCCFGLAGFTIRRIDVEERILLELFGDQYLEYCRNVPALGPGWSCLGFDKHPSQRISHEHRNYNAIQ